MERKRIIDELEASLNGAQIYAKYIEVLVLAVEAISDEDTTAGAKYSKINKVSDNMEIDLEEELSI